VKKLLSDKPSFLCSKIKEDGGDNSTKFPRSTSPIESAGIKTLRDMIAFLYMPPLDKKSR